MTFDLFPSEVMKATVLHMMFTILSLNLLEQKVSIYAKS